MDSARSGLRFQGYDGGWFGHESIGVELTTDADGLGYYWEIDNLAAGCEQSAAIAVPVVMG